MKYNVLARFRKNLANYITEDLIVDWYKVYCSIYKVTALEHSSIGSFRQHVCDATWLPYINRFRIGKEYMRFMAPWILYPYGGLKLFTNSSDTLIVRVAPFSSMKMAEIRKHFNERIQQHAKESLHASIQDYSQGLLEISQEAERRFRAELFGPGGKPKGASGRGTGRLTIAMDDQAYLYHEAP